LGNKKITENYGPLEVSIRSYGLRKEKCLWVTSPVFKNGEKFMNEQLMAGDVVLAKLEFHGERRMDCFVAQETLSVCEDGKSFVWVPLHPITT
ncbi:hypothetical protein COY25_02370, partial [Candidatus Uhrbacteria bacterium CG_4_10_14_0_2_um_filter_41_7]